MNHKYQLLEQYLFEDSNDTLTDIEKEREANRLEKVRTIEKTLKYFLYGSIVLRLISWSMKSKDYPVLSKVLVVLGNLALTFFVALGYIIGKISIYYFLKFKSECISKCKKSQTEKQGYRNCVNDCRHKAYKFVIDKLEQEKTNCKALKDPDKINRCESIIQRRIDKLVENQKSYSEYQIKKMKESLI